MDLLFQPVLTVDCEQVYSLHELRESILFCSAVVVTIQSPRVSLSHKIFSGGIIHLCLYHLSYAKLAKAMISPDSPFTLYS